MTTHATSGPDTAAPPAYPQHPPSSTYPTAPPWASPREPAPAQVAGTPYGAPGTQHGQLLVLYPEEMYNAARPKPPSWWPVVAWTALLGVLGIVPARRRARLARRGRNSAAPYWVAWGATMAVLSVVGLTALSAGVPAYLDYREQAVTKAVQSDLQNGKQLQESAGVTATSARCEPLGPRDTTGTRRYDCTLALKDGRTGSLTVTADSDGRWAAAPKQ